MSDGRLGPRALEVLFEAEGLPSFDLPEELAAIYGGSLGFDEPRLVANFVQSIDGVVAIPAVPGSNKLIAGQSPADRFVLGLLRACADVLVIGSGTLTASPSSTWTAEQACPSVARGYAELSRRLGRSGPLEVAVLTSSGRIDPSHPALEAGAIVLTSDEGAERLAHRLPAAAELVSLGDAGVLEPDRIVATLHERGHRLILSEGGPTAIGPLLAARLVDELFLTVSPLLVGRADGEARLALVEGADLLPGGPLAARLLGVRRDVGHLFLRYELARPS
jgi:riboflavin biosynthesis pyrimidine reductase